MEDFKTSPRYNYRDHGNDKYYGRRFFTVSECSGSQFRVKESILVRNKEGLLGFIGDGPVWALNYMTDTGACCFNPLKEEDVVWSGFHHCYILKEEKDHFEFPVIVGQYYRLEDGKKFVNRYPEVEYPKLPSR